MSNHLQTKQIPILDLKAQYQQIQNEVENVVLEVLRSGHYVLGPNVEAFEKEAAAFLKTKYCVGCANGSDALYIALLALNIKPGDEVITTPFTYVATAEAITQIGAQPVFADIDLNTFNLDPQEIEKKITQKTKAIIVVHLYGQSCDMKPIMEIAKSHNLRVIEDTAQAFGTQYDNQYTGTIADIGTYSFYPTKNLSCAGDGGMLSTNSEELNQRLRKIRVHGSTQRYYHDELGVNSRLDELQAAVLRVKLKYINDWNRRRAQIAQAYNQAFDNFENESFKLVTPKLIDKSTHIYHQYALKIETKLQGSSRDAFKEQLKKVGVASEIYYPLPLHLQKLYNNLGYQENDLPNACKAASSVLCLPIYPELNDQAVEQIIQAVKQVKL